MTWRDLKDACAHARFAANRFARCLANSALGKNVLRAWQNGRPIPYAISRSPAGNNTRDRHNPGSKGLMGSALLRQHRQHRLRIKAPVPVRAEDSLDPRHLHCR
jgi:hypothetical protein